MVSWWSYLHHRRQGGDGAGGGAASTDRVKLDTINAEYTSLLNSQLELQRLYFEEKLLAASDKASAATSRADAAEMKQNQLQLEMERLKDQSREDKELARSSTANASQLKQKAAVLTTTAGSLENALKDERSLTEAMSLKIKHLEQELRDQKSQLCEMQDQSRDLMFALGMRDREDLQGGTMVTNPLGKTT